MTDPLPSIADIVASAPIVAPVSGVGATPDPPQPPDADSGDEPSPEIPRESVDPEIVARCALLEQNDTDNGRRMILHFGPDILHARDVGWHVWAGTHFELAGGDEAITRFAQRTARRIALEGLALGYSPVEERAIAAAQAAERAVRDGKPSPEQAKALADGQDAVAALKARKSGRRKFGISAGNASRVAATISQALPHVSVPQDALDADPLVLNLLNGTLRLARVEDLDCPDPDAVRWTVSAEITPHDRAQRLTKVAPVRFDPDASCPRWRAFIERFQPAEPVRRFLQAFFGYALTGLSGEQIFLYMHGAGANGKSTFIEALSRLIGPYAEILNSESLTGQGQRRGDQATPDFARLPGARMVRVSELARGEPLREALVKALTGGEPMLARHLNKGFFKFTPVFKAVMSGNDLPQIGGVDHGIWRRIRLVPWTVTIPDAEQRPMAEILAEFEAERSGILNWLIEGLGIYFAEGLRAPAEVTDATRLYREEMDPISGFVADCVERVPGSSETARTMFEAFESWCLANAKRPWKETAFGRAMPLKGFPKTSERVRRYLDVRLHDVPPRPETRGDPPRSPFEGEHDR